MTYFKQCLSKQQKNNNLEEEISAHKNKLRYQQRSAKEGFFGSSTPSAKIPVKPNRRKEHQRNRGGGKVDYRLTTRLNGNCVRWLLPGKSALVLNRMPVPKLVKFL
jgi:hypothetical protein